MRKLIGPKNQLMSATIAYFVLLRLSSKKNMVAKSTGRVNCANAINPSSYKFKFHANFSVNIIICQ